MPSTMAPTKAMARYAVTTLSLPTNVMTLLQVMPLDVIPLDVIPLAIAQCSFAREHHG